MRVKVPIFSLILVLLSNTVTAFSSWRSGSAMLNMAVNGVKKVTVIGGGFGGLYSALKIAKISKDREENSSAVKTEVTLIDPKDKFVFLPLLYELAVETASVQEVAPKYSELLDKTSVKFVQGSVESIDVEKRQVLTKSSTEIGKEAIVSYDRLVVACGAQPNLASVPGLKDFAIPFARVEDSYRIKTRLRSLTERVILTQLRW